MEHQEDNKNIDQRIDEAFKSARRKASENNKIKDELKKIYNVDGQLEDLKKKALKNSNNLEELKKIYYEALKLTANAKLHALEVVEKVGITEADINKWLQEDPNFKKKIESLPQYFLEEAEIGLLKTIKAGNTTSILFYLTNRAPNKWLIPPKTVNNTAYVNTLTDVTRLMREAQREAARELKSKLAEQNKFDSDEKESKESKEFEIIDVEATEIKEDTNGTNGTNESTEPNK
jgi:hypothetical protein